MIELGISKVPHTKEYRVYWIENGIDREEKAYYTDDWWDAVTTLLDIESRSLDQGLPVEVMGGRTRHLIRKYDKSLDLD